MFAEVLAAAAICGAVAAVCAELRALVVVPPVVGSVVGPDDRRVHASRVDSSAACAGFVGFGRVEGFVVSAVRTLMATVLVADPSAGIGVAARARPAVKARLGARDAEAGDVGAGGSTATSVGCGSLRVARAVVVPASSVPGSSTLSTRRDVEPLISDWAVVARFVAVVREIVVRRRSVVGASVDSGLSFDVRRADRGWATDGRGVPAATPVDDCEAVEPEISANATPGMQASAVPIPSATASAPIRPICRAGSEVELRVRWTDAWMVPATIS